MASRNDTTGLGYGGSCGENPCITRFHDSGSVESHRYYLARRTVMGMLRDRGCVVPDADITRSLAEFRSLFGNKHDLERFRITAPFRSNPSKKLVLLPGKESVRIEILVIFCGTDEIRKQVAISILLQIVNKESLHRVILILQSKMNGHAQKVVDEFPVKVETFHITELLVNITKHVLEAKHQILTFEEKKNLLKKFNVEDNKIPRMLETDAIARYYGTEEEAGDEIHS